MNELSRRALTGAPALRFALTSPAVYTPTNAPEPAIYENPPRGTV